jgi:hypothetical protein
VKLALSVLPDAVNGTRFSPQCGVLVMFMLTVLLCCAHVKSVHVMSRRQDVAAMNRMRALTTTNSTTSTSNSSTLSLQSAISTTTTISDAPTSTITDDEGDGLLQVEAAAVLRFPDDHRAREACRMLRCTRRQLLRLDRAPEVTDHEFAARQQQRLLLLCERMLAAAPARGMLTLGQCLPSLLQDPLPLAIPPLCLAGRATPGGIIVALNAAAADVAADLTHWPEFHNGVAAGLRLAAAGGTVPCMTRSWVLYNRGTTASSGGSSKSHDGFLLALGLQRHLQALTGHDISRYTYCINYFIHYCVRYLSSVNTVAVAALPALAVLAVLLAIFSVAIVFYPIACAYVLM